MHNHLYLGIDIGSVSVKTALVDDSGMLLAETYARIQGDPGATLVRELGTLFARHDESRVAAAGITGSGGKQLAPVLGARFVNEIIAQAGFARAFHPSARTIIEMGGEDGKLILLEPDAATAEARIEDFSMNSACAAGTGSFLDQQANRLHLTIEEFGSIALRSHNPPRLAGRCSVFAKSDMIHLQQIATPDHDIVAGLCFAMARNFKATVGKGQEVPGAHAFPGRGRSERRNAPRLPGSAAGRRTGPERAGALQYVRRHRRGPAGAGDGRAAACLSRACGADRVPRSGRPA